MCENKRTEGFTLAELLIVVAIIGVLVAVSIPIFTSQLEKSKQATDLANMRSAKAAAIAEWMTEGMPDWSAGNHYYDAASGRIVTTVPSGYGKSSKNASEFASELNASGIPNDGSPTYMTLTISDSGVVSIHWGDMVGSIWASLGHYSNNSMNGGSYSTSGATAVKQALIATDDTARKKADQDALNAIASYFNGKSLTEVQTVLGSGKHNNTSSSSVFTTHLFEYSVNSNGEIRFMNMPVNTEFLTKLGYTPKLLTGSGITNNFATSGYNYADEYLFKSNEMILATNGDDGDYNKNKKSIQLRLELDANGNVKSSSVYVLDPSNNPVDLS